MTERERMTEYEVVNRVKNLAWTISGDYSLDIQVDVETYRHSKYAALYDAVKQGALSKYFDRSALTMYLIQKIYLGADADQLMQLAQVCVDAATYGKISAERAGIREIRRRSFGSFFRGNSAVGSFSQILTLTYMARELYPESPRALEDALALVDTLTAAEDTREIIVVIDRLYNTFINKNFEELYGTLEDVLAVTEEELAEAGWFDELKKTREVSALNRVTSLSDWVQNSSEAREKTSGGTGIVTVTEDDLEKMQQYLEVHYGDSILSRQEQERLDRAVCTGVHEDCSIYMTRGLLKKEYSDEPAFKAAQKIARHFKEKNIDAYYHNRTFIRKNIAELTDLLKKALLRRSERELRRMDNGALIVRELWKVGRTEEDKLFLKEENKDSSAFVVDILIDASGSQRARQGAIAMQAFIISEALSAVGLPFRVMSFSTFWEYTVLHLFRDYEDGRGENRNLFDYRAMANNRDGLAIRAACEKLSKRHEQNKLLIVLSDGRPNNVLKNRPNHRNPTPYVGDYAVRDTAAEVRRARGQGISVMGIFTGEEQDLPAERRIYGTNFAYTRRIENFSHIVGRYLKKQLDEE